MTLPRGTRKVATTFLWGWRHYDRTPDIGMTRNRMAKLMRAWRRGRTQGHRNFSLKRLAPHVYYVNAEYFVGESATFEIRTLKDRP